MELYKLFFDIYFISRVIISIIYSDIMDTGLKNININTKNHSILRPLEKSKQFFFIHISLMPVIHFPQNTRKQSQNAKNEKHIAGYFVFCAPFFPFHILHQDQHLRKKSKDFVVYFFAALIKHEIRMKYEKCIASVSYFMARFAKTFAK